MAVREATGQHSQTMAQAALPFPNKKIRAGGRPGRTDPRGNSTKRRNDKNKLLQDKQFTHTTGTGWPDSPPTQPNVHCKHCGIMLTYDTVERDRVKPGGPYAYHNLQPACRGCNTRRSNNEEWQGPLAKASA